MLSQHIALVPEAEGVNVTELARVSAALQRQVICDLAPIWGVVATVDAFPYLEDVPIGYWPIVLTFCELGRDSGVHIDGSGQPYAQVQMSSHWSLAASRACLEMLINPFGGRTVTAPSLRSGQGPVEYMLEVCGPCGDARFAYPVNDLIVSDFCTPAFFAADSPQPQRYSFAGSLTAPLQLLPGGHLTWYDPVSGRYWLRSHWGDNPVDSQVGAVAGHRGQVLELLNACASLRRRVDRKLRERYDDRIEHARRASMVQAQRLRALLGTELDRDLGATPRPAVIDRERDRPTLPSRPRLPVDRELSDYEEVELGDIEEVTEVDLGGVERAAPFPTPAPSHAESATASVAGTPPSLRTTPRPDAREMPSLAPMTLRGEPEHVPARLKTTALAALAAAAVLALFWISRSSEPRAAPRAPRARAAAATHLQAAAAAVPASARPTPSAQPSPSAPPSTPAQLPPPARVAAAAGPAGTARARAAPQAERAAQPEAASARRAKRAARHELPEPAPPSAARPNDGLQTASIEDLIETRK